MVTSSAWNWPPTDTPLFETAGRNQYRLMLRQSLVPVAWEVWTEYPPADYPSKCLHKVPGTFIEQWIQMEGSVFSQKWPATATFEALFSPPPVGLDMSLADVIDGNNGRTKMPVHNDSPPAQ
jgi:hypothetical protein